jgi:hypothetical protein
MMGLQNSLEKMRSSSERIDAVKSYFSENGQKVVNPDTKQEMWIYKQSELESCRTWYREKMFDNREFKVSGYMAVNGDGRCGWKLLPMACHLEDYSLIDYLLEQGANRTVGCDGCDIMEAAEVMKWDKEAMARALKYVASKPELPDFYWVSRLGNI